MAARRLLRGAAWLAGGAVVAPPALAAVALVRAGADADAGARAMLASLPRTARAAWWGVETAYAYKALAARHAALPEKDGKEGPPYKEALSALHASAAQALLACCQANGGVYIKAGQLAVALRGVPPEYASTLEALQDRVPPRPAADIEAAIAGELGAPPTSLFRWFDPRATAAASLAQVHRAVLHDGTAVAVKVQYPGLGAEVAADLATLGALAALGAALFPASDWRWLVRELDSKLQLELDFRVEASNARRAAAALGHRRDVAVPGVHGALSGRRVLCMDWEDGCKVSDAAGIAARGLRPRDVGRLLLDVFAEMVMEAGFVHGDPHPGNILVRARPRGPSWLRALLPAGWAQGPQLVLLDNGQYSELPAGPRLQYCRLWAGLALGDAALAQEAGAALAGERAGRLLVEALRPRDWARLSQEDRLKFRRDAGIEGGLPDFSRLLEGAPRPLLDVLRIMAVVRHSAAALGATLADRWSTNATHALRGLHGSRGGGGTGSGLAWAWRRARLALRVARLRAAAWAAGLG